MDTSRNANNSKRNVIFIIVGIVLAVLVGVWCFSAVISNQKKVQEIRAILPGTEFVSTQSGTEKEKLEWKYTFESDRDVIFNYTYTDLHGKILEEKCSQENFEYTYNVSLFGSVSVTFNGNKWTFSLDDTGNPMSMQNSTYGTYYRNGYRGYTSSGAESSSGSHTLVFSGGLFLATTIIFIALLVAFIKTKPVAQRKELGNWVKNKLIPVLVILAIAVAILIGINAFGNSSNGGNTDTCTICGKKATHTFQGSGYCDNHYEDAINWALTHPKK